MRPGLTQPLKHPAPGRLAAAPGPRGAAAIGEGSMAVRLVFDRLKSTGSTNAIDLGPPA